MKCNCTPLVLENGDAIHKFGCPSDIVTTPNKARCKTCGVSGPPWHHQPSVLDPEGVGHPGHKVAPQDTSNISNDQPTNTDELRQPLIDLVGKMTKLLTLKNAISSDEIELGKQAMAAIEETEADLAAYIEREKVALLNELLDAELPWPKDVFGEVPKDDWSDIDDWLRENKGYAIDTVSATLMRRGWKCFERVVKEELAALTGGSDE